MKHPNITEEDLAELYFSIMEDIVSNSCKEHRAEIIGARTIHDKTLDEVFEELIKKLKPAIAKGAGYETKD